MTTQSGPYIITPGIAEALLFAFQLFSFKKCRFLSKSCKSMEWNEHISQCSNYNEGYCPHHKIAFSSIFDL